MTRDQVIAANPLQRFLADRGYDLRSVGRNFVTSACPVTAHKKFHRPVTIDIQKQVWHCNDCNIGGTVIDWVMHEKSVTAAEATGPASPPQPPAGGPPPALPAAATPAPAPAAPARPAPPRPPRP